MGKLLHSRYCKSGHAKSPLGSPRAIASLVAAIFIVGVIIYAVFRTYSLSLSDEFYKISSEGMNDFTVAQKVEVESGIQEIRSTLATMRSLAESSDIDPEGATFTSYLETWNNRDSFQVSYSTIALLEESLSKAPLPEPDHEVLRRLKAGNEVVSDVRKSIRLGGYYYSIAEPVVRDGSVVGVLRSIVNAESLLETSQASSQVTLVGSALMKDDGAIVPVSESEKISVGTSVYALLGEAGFSAEIIESVRSSVDDDETVATVMLGRRDGRMLFFTSIRLGVNDWNIVNITEENTMAEHSQVILRDTIIAGVLLIALGAIGCVIVAFVIMRYQRRAVRETERYAVLSEFTDTVLFEYSYLRDSLEFTPNARSVFTLDELRRDRYLERAQPLLDFHEEDRGKFEEMIENPVPEGEIKKITLRVRVLTGEYRWFSCVCRYLYSEADLYAMVGKIVDITQQRATEEQLIWQSQIDGLTKVYNKVTAEKKISSLLTEDRQGLLFVIDVDRFKAINDQYGHTAGDRVLAAIAHVLMDVFRRSDPVGRIGGDEFVAYAADAVEDRVVMEKRAAILDQVAVASKTVGVPIALSIGVARYPVDGITYQELFNTADEALYQEKRGETESASPDMPQ